MKVIKNNKGIFITLFIILVLLVTGMIVLRAFFPSGNEYGNRLKGISKVAFSNKEIKALEKKIDDCDEIKKVSVNIKGRLINIIMTIDKDKSVDDMKDHAKNRLEVFDEDELKYYDVQIYLVSEDSEKEAFIGYKNKARDEIRWSNN